MTESSIDIRARPAEDSVERALDQIGDRWTFLILREAFFGVRRFDELRRNTGASPAVLTDRLKHLVANDVLTKVRYGNHPNRFDYHLTDKGRDLYPMIVLLLQWGDRWLTDGAQPPVVLTHECGTDGPFILRCAGCDEPVEARTTDWQAANRD
jgi:DNA-binding HxlR family transcriptional regulator